MITPQLERLILSGRAAFNTFVAGGTEKSILNVPRDHCIIITSISYASALKSKKIVLTSSDLSLLSTKYNTQVKIFSAKSLNTFLFRDQLSISPELTGTIASGFFVTPVGDQKIDTYLVHETDVSFTFSFAGKLADELRNITDSNSIAYSPPMDYGKEGQAGAFPVRNIGSIVTSTSGNDYQAGGGQLYVKNDGKNTPKENIFPVDLANRYNELDEGWAYPILNVNYVLIQGAANNLSST